MQSSSACWATYGELTARIMSRELSDTDGPGRGHHMDCYAVQHPGGAAHDRRQRQSVAVHLIALCLHLEHERPAVSVCTARAQTSHRVLPSLGLSQWPYLAPPSDMGAVTATDVNQAATPDELVELLVQWSESAWSAWSAHHELIRFWAEHA